MNNTCIVWAPYSTRHIIDIIKKTGAKSMLDIGCGTGGFTIEAAIAGCKAIGMDPCREVIELAEHKYNTLALGREDFVNEIWRLATILDEDRKIFCSGTLDNDYGQPAMGDFDNHEEYLNGLPIQRNLDLEFLIGTETDADTDLTICMNVLHCLEQEDANNLLAKLAASTRQGNYLSIAYMGYPSTELGSVCINDSSMMFAPENEYGYVGNGKKLVQLGHILEHLGYEDITPAKTQQEIASYVASMMFQGPYAQVTCLMQCYLGRRREKVDMSIEEAVHKVFR